MKLKSSTSEEYQADYLTKKVQNLDLTFHWMSDGRHFWFRRESDSGGTYSVVDARLGTEGDAIDATSLEKAVEAVAGASNDPRQTTIIGLEEDANGDLKVRTPTKEIHVDRSSMTATTVKELLGESYVLSNDGRLAVFSRDFNLWILEIDTGRQRQLTQGGESDFRYGGLDPSYDRQVVRRRRVGREEPLQGVIWSPDGRYILALKQDFRHWPSRLYVTEYAPPDGHFSIPHFRKACLASDAVLPACVLGLVDVETGEERAVDIDPQSFNDYAMYYFAWRLVWWSAEKVFFITANRGGTRYGLIAVDLVSANAKEVVSETAERAICLNQCDYNYPNVHVTTNGEELIWYSERSGIGHLYLYDVKTGALKNQITSGNSPVFDLVRVDEVRRLMFFVAASGERNSNPYLRYLYAVSFDGGPVRLITKEIADHRFNNCMQPFKAITGAREGDVLPGSSISPNGEYLVDTFSTIGTPPRYSIHHLHVDIQHELLSADASVLIKDGWLPPEEFVVKAADGKTDLWGSITFPREFDAAKSYPVIDTMYPGPQGSFSPRCFVDQLAGGSIHHLQTFADAGFIVVTLDGRGTRHRSREFHDAFFGTTDVFGAQDHQAAIVNLAIGRPYMDLSRVGIRGQSFGGYGALRAMLLFPEFFKVGVCATGPGDYMDAQGQTFVERFFGIPGSSTAVRQHYRDISNLSAANRLSGRALLVHGGLDENVPLKHAFALLDAFIGADKDVDMLFVPNSPHSVPKEPYVIRRSVQYFLDHL